MSAGEVVGVDVSTHSGSQRGVRRGVGVGGEWRSMFISLRDHESGHGKFYVRLAGPDGPYCVQQQSNRNAEVASIHRRLVLWYVIRARPRTSSDDK